MLRVGSVGWHGLPTSGVTFVIDRVPASVRTMAEAVYIFRLGERFLV